MMLMLATLALADSAEALQSLKDGKLLTARRLAEEALVTAPDDFVAHYVVGEVYWKKDGNLPRAAHHLDRADDLFVAHKPSLPEEAWRTHWYVLRSKAWVAEGMERTGLYLDTVERYNQLYDPDLKAETGWVLMKAERTAEARQIAEEALASDDTWQQTLGHNVLCALESKVLDRQAAYDACLAAVAFSRASDDAGGVLVDAYNASVSAASVLDFAQAEALLKESASSGSGTTTNPWASLAVLYLLQGRGADAVGAAQQMQRWRHGQSPPDRAQSRAGADATLSLVLLVAGQADRALEVIDRALSHPDRRASTTTGHAATRANHTLIRRAIRRLAAQQQAEEVATQGLGWRVKHWLAGFLPDAEAWAEDATLTGILQDADLLARSTAAYEDDGMVAATFLAGDLVGVVGPGVMQAAIDQGRTRDPFDGLVAYYDGLEAEVALHRGQRRAADLAERALQGLPEAEVLLRARVAAVGAASAWSYGDPRAYGLYEQSLQLDPSSLRRLGLPLPATVTSSGSSLDDAIAAMLRRSPRFASDAQGFQVSVNAGQVCLASPLGNRLGCHGGEADGDEHARARSAFLAFHRNAFALPLGLQLDDLRSLDSLTTLDAETRQRALDAVLEGL